MIERNAKVSRCAQMSRKSLHNLLVFVENYEREGR